MSQEEFLQLEHSTLNGEAPIEHEPTGEELVQPLANVFHEVWLRTRNKRNKDGVIIAEREQREKSTKDTDWVRAAGKDEAIVDIANTGFVDLPKDWQAENIAAAKTIVELIEGFGGADNINLNDPDVYDKVGEIIHDHWLERNTYAAGGELDIPFAELSKAEQEKDLVQLRIALSIFAPEPEDVPHRSFAERALQTVNNWALERRLPIRTAKGELLGPGDPDGWMYYEDQHDALISGLR